MIDTRTHACTHARALPRARTHPHTPTHQEAWYKYQRYVPHTKNNLPAPPINDFDFLNSFARDYYRETRAKTRYDANAGSFDDFNLGNMPAKTWGAVVEPRRDHIDGWNLGKRTCVGASCFDSSHQARSGTPPAAHPCPPAHTLAHVRGHTLTT